MTAMPQQDQTRNAPAAAPADAPTATDRARHVFVVLAAVAEIVAATTLSQAFDNSTASNTRVFFVPAGYTFSVWGLIFATALAYAVYQTGPSQAARTLHRRIGWPYGLTMLGAAVWLGISVVPNRAVANGATTAVIVAMLACATLTLVRLRALNGTLTRQDRALAQAPATFYFAWLTLATIANATAFLTAIGWTGGDAAPLYAIAMLAIGTLLASGLALTSPSRTELGAYSGVAVWALVGILVNNLDLSAPVATTAGVGALVVGLVTAARWARLSAAAPHPQAPVLEMPSGKGA